MDARFSIRLVSLCIVAGALSLLTRCHGQELIDPAKATIDADGKVAWYNVQLLDIEGKGWTDTLAFHDRLPAKAEALVRPDVWRLSRQGSGVCVRFVTDATTLQVDWSLGIEPLAEPNMPATAISGLDLYVKHEGKWRWLSVGKPEQKSNQAVLFKDIPDGDREFLLYLPLYNIVTSLKLGIPKGAYLAKAVPWATDRKPIVIYGTSITQGGCVSRPGMVYTAILGRRLNRPVINLGFRSNGTMDPELATLMTELDPAVFVIDCLGNLFPPEVAERTEPLVKILRKARPDTPILLAEDRTYPNGILDRPRRERNEGNRAALKAAYERLQQAGFKNIHYLTGAQLLGDDGEATVDNSHPSDLGSMRLADAFESVLRPVLGD